MFLDNSRRRKVYAEFNGLKVGLLEVELTPTHHKGAPCTPNLPVRIYDTSGAWGDPNFHFDTARGLPKIRGNWISDREDAEIIGVLKDSPKNPFGGRQILRAKQGRRLTQMYYARSGLARFIYQKLTERKKKSEESGKPDLNILFIYNMPFRAIAKMTGGAVSMEMSEGMVLAVNGHFWKGLTKILFGYFRNAAANRKYAKLLARQSGGKKEA